MNDAFAMLLVFSVFVFLAFIAFWRLSVKYHRSGMYQYARELMVEAYYALGGSVLLLVGALAVKLI